MPATAAQVQSIIFDVLNCWLLQGFRLTYFADYDECSVQNGGCQHTCRNTKGGFNCSCNEGFILHEDLKSCKESECHFNLTEKPGFIQTPNYPKEYPKQKKCIWRITTAPGNEFDYGVGRNICKQFCLKVSRRN